MIVALIIGLLYISIIIASIVGIIYFIGKRLEEKKREKDILDRKDY